MTLRERILEISKKYGLSHVGSNLSAVEILDAIFPLGEVIVSSGHAGIAYFVVREKHLGEDAEELFKKYGIHAQMYGSLGHGLPIAVGKALASPEKEFYCLTSDGEWMEGSMWEALRIAGELKLKNLHIHVNANGYGGLKRINQAQLKRQLKGFDFPISFHKTSNAPLPETLDAHYMKVK